MPDPTEPRHDLPDETLFQGVHPTRVLEQLVESDALGLAARARRFVRDEGLLLDGDALGWRAAAWALTTQAAARARDLDLEVWLDDCLRAAARDLVQEDQEAEALGRPPQLEARLGFFTRALGIEPTRARRAAILVNTAPLSARRTFQALCLQRRALDQYAHETGRAPAVVAAELRATLQSLSQLGDVPLQGEETGHA